MRRFAHRCPELRALHASLRQQTSRRSAAASPFVSIRAGAGARHIHATPISRYADKTSSQATAPANLSELDMLGNTPAPSTSVDVVTFDGFGLNSGITIDGGDGALLVNGEAFAWRPWEVRGEKRMVNDKGQFDIPKESLSVFSVLWPRPDLLIIGAGKTILPLSPETRTAISELGMRVEVLDTRNAASQFNMLATERGVDDVAAVLIPIGWEEGVGAV